MRSALRLLGMILLAGPSLSACSRNDSDEVLPVETRLVSGPVEEQFGKGFGEAFRADPNSEPATVSEGDLIPVSLTAEPVKID